MNEVVSRGVVLVRQQREEEVQDEQSKVNKDINTHPQVG
jgi:hypothetical protein